MRHISLKNTAAQTPRARRLNCVYSRASGYICMFMVRVHVALAAVFVAYLWRRRI